MFNNKLKSIEMCVSRFDSETKATFLDLYTKVDSETVVTDTDETETKDFSQPDNSEDLF